VAAAGCDESVTHALAAARYAFDMRIFHGVIALAVCAAVVQIGHAQGQRPERVRVAAIQFASEFGKPQANRQRLAPLIEEAARGGARIVVLPETAITGYMSYDLKQAWRIGERAVTGGLTGVDPAEVAETVPGESTAFFARIADAHDLYLTVPLLEVDRKTGRHYNTSVLLGPDGRIVLHYRKRNPGWWAERGWASEGDRGNPVADTPFGRLGLLICFDIHQQAEIMGGLKVDHLLYSIAWVEDEGSDWFAVRLPGIAKWHGMNIVGANWTLPRGSAKPGWFGYGQTRIIDAEGRIVAAAQETIGDAIIYADLAPPTR